MSANRRVVLLEMPHLLRDILEHAIRQQGKFELCDAARAAQREPEAVIVAGPDVTRMNAIRAMWPNTTILEIEASSGAALLHQPQFPAQALGQRSATELLDALDRATP